MADMGRSDGLRTIFSFFLGLILGAFLGVGVYTFHPPPEQDPNRVQELSRRERAIRKSRPHGELTAVERDELQEISRQREAMNDAVAEAQKPWGQSTSVILIALATLAMAISLVRADQLPVISNGVLLGGIFTMLYGVGWIIATGTSMARFVVMTVALAITLVLGYVRFVRRGKAAPVGAGPAAPASEGLADVQRRIRDLEERVDEAAAALTHKRGGSSAS